MAEVHNPNKSSSDKLQWPEKQPKPRRAYTGNPRHSLGGFWQKLDKIFAGGEGKKYPARHHEECIAHKK